MKKNNPKIIVVLGPTASGKSAIAVKIAKKFNGEVISADSRQVYEGLNIGSGKITKKEMRRIPHHLLDVCSPKKIFTVENFKQLANKNIQNILGRDNLPIICGGTGFYIDSLIENITFPEVKADDALRRKLEKLETKKLFEMLKDLDKKRARKIDPKNKVRIIRAIEIAKALGKVPKIKSKPLYKSLKIGIELERETLREKIDKRLVSRIKAGMIKEAKNLHRSGLSWKRMEALGLEYKYLALFLQKKITKEQMITELKNKIWQYAKRQLAWFKRDKDILWLKPEEFGKVEGIIKEFLR